MATLEGTIHVRWAAKAALNALLPSSRFFTGPSRQTILPYCILSREISDQALQTNAARYDHATMRFMIVHVDHDLGLGIFNQLCRKASDGGFHLDQFDITGGGRVVNMKKGPDYAFQDEKGTWIFIVDFEVTHKLI